MSVGRDGVQAAEPSTSELKAQGNLEFKNQNYLKAAALYSRAIKLQPSDAPAEELAVLYSNRSAAVLQLNKVSKALADADECIKLRPEWDKGYFRRASALEKMDKYTEALTAYQEAVAKGADGKQLQDKIRFLTKMTQRKGFKF